MSEYRLPNSNEMVRARPLRRLLEPWLERRHLYQHYSAFLDEIVVRALEVVPLREFRGAKTEGRTLLGLRHDIDDRLESALELASLEHSRGIRSTYFVLHAAAYYKSPKLLPTLRELQRLGHEVGFHYDLVTSQIVRRVDSREELRAELERLRAGGIDVVGAAAHGSYWGHKLGYKNEYFFRELSIPRPEFPNSERVGDVPLAKGTLSEFGLAYDASQLGETNYWTDSWVDAKGHRWHPDLLDLEALEPDARAIVLVHPCHWDLSLGSKYIRTLRRLTRRLFGRRV